MQAGTSTVVFARSASRRACSSLPSAAFSRLSVSLALTDLYNNGCKWPTSHAGQSSTLGAANDCVGLPTEPNSWRFTTFTVEQYNTLFQAVKAGTVAISNNTDVQPQVTIAVNYEQ